MKKILLLLISFSALSIMTVSANDKELVNQILQNNQTIESLRLSSTSSILQLKTEGNLPDPEVEMEIMAKPINSIELTASETIEWPGVYGARRNARNNRIDAEQYLFQSKCNEIIKEVRLSYVELISINAQLTRSRKLLSVVDSILSKVANPNLKGDYTVLDISKLKIEAFDLSSSISSLEIRRQVILNDLKLQNGGKDLQSVDLQCTAYPVELKPLDAYIMAYYESPEYKVVLSTLAANQYDIKANRMSGWPNIKLGYKFVKEADVKAHGAVVGISIPIFSNRGKVKASQAEGRSTDYTKSYLVKKGEAEIESKYSEIINYKKMIEKYEDSVNYEEVKSYLDSSLSSKSITIVDYLSEYKFVLSALQKVDEMQMQLAEKYVDLLKYCALH